MNRSKADDDAVTNALVGDGLYLDVWLPVAACLLSTVRHCNGLTCIVASKCLIDETKKGFFHPETRLVKGGSQTPPAKRYQKYDG
jgi:hypothetical protein